MSRNLLSNRLRIFNRLSADHFRCDHDNCRGGNRTSVEMRRVREVEREHQFESDVREVLGGAMQTLADI